MDRLLISQKESQPLFGGDGFDFQFPFRIKQLTANDR